MLEEGNSPRVLFRGMAAPVRLFSSPSPVCSSPSRGDEKETRFGLSVCGWWGRKQVGLGGQAVWGQQGTCAWGGSLALSLHVPPTQAACACHGAREESTQPLCDVPSPTSDVPDCLQEAPPCAQSLASALAFPDAPPSLGTWIRVSHPTWHATLSSLGSRTL